MARPKKSEKKVQFTIMLEPSMIEEIKALADRGEIPAGTFARNLLKIGLDDARILDRSGLIKLVGSSRKQIEKMKKRFNLNFEDLDIYPEEDK